MEGYYGVCFGRDMVGKVQVLQQGLYYRIICRCRISGEIVCRLMVSCGGKKENLGIVVPMDGGFGLDTRIPAKRLAVGTPEFILVPKYEASTDMFVPIYPEEPFAYISRLKDAYLTRKNGQLGIGIKENQGCAVHP